MQIGEEIHFLAQLGPGAALLFTSGSLNALYSTAVLGLKKSCFSACCCGKKLS